MRLAEGHWETRHEDETGAARDELLRAAAAHHRHLLKGDQIGCFICCKKSGTLSHLFFP